MFCRECEDLVLRETLLPWQRTTPVQLPGMAPAPALPHQTGTIKDNSITKFILFHGKLFAFC